MHASRIGFAGLMLLAHGAVVQPPLEAQRPLPDAVELIEGYVEARGGRDAILAPPSLRSTGTMELTALGAEGTIEHVITRDGVMVMTMVVPGMGEMRMGYDGQVGWSLDDLMGPRLLEGAELAAVEDMANPLADIRDASLLETAETVERREMGGEPCWLVSLQWRSGRTSFDCYHVETGLLVGMIDNQESPMGTVEVRSYIEEYREFQGVLFPVRTTQHMAGSASVIHIESIRQYDADPSELEPPPAIRALLDR